MSSNRFIWNKKDGSINRPHLYSYVHTEEFVRCSASTRGQRDTNSRNVPRISFSPNVVCRRRKKKTQNFNIKLSAKLFLLLRTYTPSSVHLLRSHVAKYIIVITWNMHHTKIWMYLSCACVCGLVCWCWVVCCCVLSALCWVARYTYDMCSNYTFFISCTQWTDPFAFDATNFA